MTKRHFIALADTIRSNSPAFSITAIEALARFCHDQNRHFDHERWIGYIAGTCGANGVAIKPPSQPRYITPERKLARRLEGK